MPERRDAPAQEIPEAVEPPDAATAYVSLRIKIEHHGRVQVEGIGSCDSPGVTNGDCTFMVPKHVMRSLTAVTTDKDFVDWTTANCAGKGVTCTITPTTAVLVGAKFE